MAGSEGHLPSHRPIIAALRGAAIAFAVAGFIRALTVAIAAHTEPAVMRKWRTCLARIHEPWRGIASAWRL